jgi:Ca2+/H+ antiporter
MEESMRRVVVCVQIVNQTYSTGNSNWLKPLVVMQARRVQFGGRLDF